jgi:hypothetical protein
VRSKKVLVGVVTLLLLIISQVPFVYRRYKLRRLSQSIQQLNAQRTTSERKGFVEFEGVVHVHSFLGGHSEGTFSEIIAAAQSNQLQFVVMTEHTEKDFDTAAMTLQGMHGGVLFINGNEVRAANGDRTLVLPGDVSIIAYPEEFKNWEARGVTGVEVYNVYTNSRRINPVVAFFDVLWSKRSYPDLMFALYLQRPDESLRKWDQALTGSKLTAIGGNDAHANIGLSLKDSSGKTLFGIQLDPYEVSFRLVRLHVLIEENRAFEASSVLEAIRAGHCYLGFDFLGDASGFSFAAENAGDRRIQGDEISLREHTKLRVQTPAPARIVLYKDGVQLSVEDGLASKEFAVTERGVYRVEINRLGTLGQKPWIISNPIYVK